MGAYGAGKSTALHQVARRYPAQIWFEFDAWKYPERKDLWENFVLELAKKFGGKTFERIEKIIDGKQNEEKKALLHVAAKGANLLMPGASIIGKLDHFLATSPATRTYQIQKILTNLIEEHLQNKDVVFVLEDIDRSGEAGIFFIETLKAYLNSLKIDTNIKCIVPVAADNYDSKIDSYLKCTDMTEFFRTPTPKLEAYFEDLFDGEQFGRYGVGQMIFFCERLFTKFPTDMSLRKLKYIIRTADSKFEIMNSHDLKPDPCMVILIEATRLLGGESSTSLFWQFLSNGINDSLFCDVLLALERRTPVSEGASASMGGFQLAPKREPVGDDLTCRPWRDLDFSMSSAKEGHVHSFYFDY